MMFLVKGPQQASTKHETKYFIIITVFQFSLLKQVIDRSYFAKFDTLTFYIAVENRWAGCREGL